MWCSMNLAGIRSRGLAGNRRLFPRLWDCDYLHLITLREAVRHFAEQCTGDVIDYGAGSKPYRELFFRATSYRGADVLAGGPDDLVLTPEGALPCEEGGYDHVLSFQVLEHVPSPNLFLSECLRVLRPGGDLMLTTHGTWPYHPGPYNDDFLRWTAAGLVKQLLEAGFETVRVEPVCGGLLCLLQQALVLHDPARTARGPVASFLFKSLSLGVNLIGISLRTLIPHRLELGDIIPICYLLRATRPIS